MESGLFSHLKTVIRWNIYCHNQAKRRTLLNKITENKGVLNQNEVGKAVVYREAIQAIILKRSLLKWSASKNNYTKSLLMIIFAHYKASALRKTIWATKRLNKRIQKMLFINLSTTQYTPRMKIRNCRHCLRELKAMTECCPDAMLTFFMLIDYIRFNSLFYLISFTFCLIHGKFNLYLI